MSDDWTAFMNQPAERAGEIREARLRGRSVCRHCATRIKPCHCGADNNQGHWIDEAFGSRWCARGSRRHEPASTEGTA